MTEQSFHNPFIIDGPVRLSHAFFGQEAVFAWIRSNLQAATARPCMALFAPPRSGKSSILWQVSQGSLGDLVLPLMIDLAQLQLESLAAFYRSLTSAAAMAAQHHGLRVTEPDAAHFVVRPLHTFVLWLSQGLLPLAEGRKLLFLFDNSEAVLPAIDAALLPVDVLPTLTDALVSEGSVFALFAVSQIPEEPLRQALAFLHQAEPLVVPPLSLRAAVALLRQPTHYALVQSVAQYVYELTQGHPYLLQLYGYALYERQAALDLHTITVADVVAVRRTVQQMLAARGEEGLTAVTASLPAYELAGAEMIYRTRAVRPLPAKRLHLAGLLLPLLLLLLGALLWQQLVVNSSAQQNEVASSLPEQTPTARILVIIVTEAAPPTPTPLPTIPPTAVPTDTPTSLPTETPTPEPTPSPPVSTPTTVPTLIVREPDRMPMVYVPAGEFLMGSLENDVMAGNDEKPQILVQMSAFYIDRYEVSVGQYAAFLTQLGRYERACNRQDCAWPRERIGATSYLIQSQAPDGSLLFTALRGFEDYPINHVSWYGAAAYCEWVGARLPTEAEWEYAARGTDGRIYPWGNDPPNQLVAVFNSDTYDNLKPVDALPGGVSPFGVYGMAGSMWEWVADWYDPAYYSKSPAVDPKGPSVGLTKVMRGGAWPNNNLADRIRAANRLGVEPNFISSTVGFRCAKSP